MRRELLHLAGGRVISRRTAWTGIMSKTLQHRAPKQVQLSRRRIPASQAFSQRAFGGTCDVPIIPLVISTALAQVTASRRRRRQGWAGDDHQARTLWLQVSLLLGVVGEFMRCTRISPSP